MAAYELWDVETGNMIGVFDTEADALRVVSDLLKVDGIDYAEALDLGSLDDQGNPAATIATGKALVRMLGALVPERSPAGTATPG